MGLIQYPPLHIRGFLEADMKAFLSAEGTDMAIAAVTFVSFCEGTRSLPPSYGRVARTIWRVENDGSPSPYVNMFEWGGHVSGLPRLRVWYAQQGDSEPIGLGAFRADGDLPFHERDRLVERARDLLGPACYFGEDRA